MAWIARLRRGPAGSIASVGLVRRAALVMFRLVGWSRFAQLDTDSFRGSEVGKHTQTHFLNQKRLNDLTKFTI